jgi:hypothetical protein
MPISGFDGNRDQKKLPEDCCCKASEGLDSVFPWFYPEDIIGCNTLIEGEICM